MQRPVDAASEPSAALAAAEIALQRGRLSEAESVYRALLAGDGQSIGALSGLGRVALAVGQPGLAAEYLQTALRHRSEDPALHDALAQALAAAGHPGAAEEAIRRAVSLDPEQPEYWYRLGEICGAQDRRDESERCYLSVLRLQPAHFRATTALANLHRDAGRLEQAGELYRAALTLKPQSAVAQWNAGLQALLEGDFASGWDGYAWGVAAGKRSRRRFRFPRWRGESLRDKAILVYAEQGLGDEVMFASCVPDVAGQAGRCILECDPRLGPLFERSFPSVMVRAVARGESGWEDEAGGVDVQCAAGDLPGHLRRDPSSFPARSAYLEADPAAIARWRSALSAGDGDDVLVGVSWRGGRRAFDRRIRTLSSADLLRLHRPEGVRFVAVQYDADRDEVEALRERGVPLAWVEGLDPRRDVDGFAAMLGALDLVICVDNSTAHLSAALGRPTWIALPYAPDWRWRADGNRSPWYPTARLFRQSAPEAWEPVLEALNGELVALAAERADGI
jgi:tetratricopeptide (TPR) repeat protein